MKRFNDVKGFTLVELIVVIAIIAILASVSVVGYQRYIDSGRFSNDTQVAASMTTVIKNHMILNPNEDFTANDVRDLIEEYHDGEFDFTPSSKDAGYFYIEASEEVIVAKYSDVEDLPQFQEVNTSSTVLMSDVEEIDFSAEPYKSSPEELFGLGTFLLTTDGSPLAYAVDIISNQLATVADIGAAYGELESYVDGDGLLGWFNQIFGGGGSQLAVLDELMTYYDPDTTLYVSNDQWSTTASDGSAITKVLFAGGISNIPSFTFEQMTLASITSLTIPKSVRTIEPNAFPESFNAVEELVLKNESGIKMFASAFAGEIVSLVENTSLVEQDYALVDLSSFVEATRVKPEPGDTLSEIGLDLTTLQAALSGDGKTVTGFSLNVTGSSFKLNIYTQEDGLYGTATVQYQTNEVTFVSNFERTFTKDAGIAMKSIPAEDHIFYILNTTDSDLSNYPEFDQNGVLAPERGGFAFLGWSNDKDSSEADWNLLTDMLTGNDTLYAVWDINDYTVAYVSNGGSSIDYETVDDGDAATEPANPERTGYTFEGWYTDNDTFNDPWDFIDPIPSSGLILYAKWS